MLSVLKQFKQGLHTSMLLIGVWLSLLPTLNIYHFFPFCWQWLAECLHRICFRSCGFKINFKPWIFSSLRVVQGKSGMTSQQNHMTIMWNADPRKGDLVCKLPYPGVNQRIAVGSFQVSIIINIEYFNFLPMGFLILCFSRELLLNNWAHCKFFLNILTTISIFKTPMDKMLDIINRDILIKILCL